MNLINAYIYDNLERNISCDEIAAHIYVCKRQLNRIILKETGLSTHKYLSLLKLNKVKDLILNTNLPLNKIAHITGFSSEFHLSNLIKQHFYSSPKELRNTTKSVEC